MSDSLLSMPKLEHIPILEGSANAQEWFHSMSQTLKAEGVWAHVKGAEDDSTAVWQASHPPPLTANSTNPQRATSTIWWIKDSCALAIIECCINPIIKSLLPIRDNVTSRTVWKKLKLLYNCVNIHAQFELCNCLDRNRLVDATDYMRFIGEFDSCRTRLAAMNAPMSKQECIMTLLCQLPHDSTWPQFKQSISQFIENWNDFETECNQVSPPFTLYTRIMARLEQECISLCSLLLTKPPGPGSEYVNVAIKKTSQNPQGVICTNCSLDNHNFNHCWKKGGGAVGQWPGGPNDPKAIINDSASTVAPIASTTATTTHKVANYVNYVTSDFDLLC